jgi:hypothetical protein
MAKIGLAGLLAAVFLFAVTNVENCNAMARQTPLAKVKAHSQQMPKANVRTLRAVEASAQGLVINVSGMLEPNDGLTDLALKIRLTNKGTQPLVVLNGGSARAPNKGAFFVDADVQGVVILSQKAYSLPDPAPTVPFTQAATVLKPGASDEIAWGVTLEVARMSHPYMSMRVPQPGMANALPRPIRKIRVCTAYLPYDKQSLEPIKGHKGFFIPIVDVVREQSLLCSPVLEL